KLRAWDGPVETVDLSRSAEIDTVGAWVVSRFARDSGAQITGASPEASRLIGAVESNGSDAEIRPPRAPFLTRVPAGVGEIVQGWGLGVVNLIGFLGAILVAIGGTIRHPSRLRATSL